MRILHGAKSIENPHRGISAVNINGVAKRSQVPLLGAKEYPRGPRRAAQLQVTGPSGGENLYNLLM